MIVLIVEDEAIIAVNLALVLEDAGHVVFGPVASSEAALGLARQHKLDVALVDINLEGEPDGLRLARELKQQGTPSVFLSAQHALAFANRDAALGFIEKPYSAANVRESLEVIDAMLHGSVARSPRSGSIEIFTD